MAGPHEWRHESEPTHRPSYFPRPADERRVIRRKSFAMAPCTVDEAAVEMDLLDYDFHLFTENGSGTAGVLYRGGPTGHRLALVAPVPADQLSPFELPVSISAAASAMSYPRGSHRAARPARPAVSVFHRCRRRPRQRPVPPLRRALRIDHPGRLGSSSTYPLLAQGKGCRSPGRRPADRSRRRGRRSARRSGRAARHRQRRGPRASTRDPSAR